MQKQFLAPKVQFVLKTQIACCKTSWQSWLTLTNGQRGSAPAALILGYSYLIEALKHGKPFVFIIVIKQLSEWDLNTCLKLCVTLVLCFIESCGRCSCGWCVQLLSVLPWLALLIWCTFPALADSFFSCFFFGLAIWKRRGGENKAAALAHWLLTTRKWRLLWGLRKH